MQHGGIWWTTACTAGRANDAMGQSFCRRRMPLASEVESVEEKELRPRNPVSSVAAHLLFQRRFCMPSPRGTSSIETPCTL